MSHGSHFVHNVYRDGRWVTEIERAPQGWRVVRKNDVRSISRRIITRRAA